VPHKLLASKLGIDDETLRKYFRQELDEGLYTVGRAIGGGLVTLATSSKDEKVRADLSKFYAECHMGWRRSGDVQTAGGVTVVISRQDAEL